MNYSIVGFTDRLNDGKNNFYKHTFLKFFIILLGNIINGRATLYKL